MNSQKFLKVIFISILALLTMLSGKTVGVLASPAEQSLGTTNQISQFGITWTFDQPYEYGQFANGDYWVVGPVTIVNINPPSTNIGGRVINGSMVNPSPLDGNVQGYDSSMSANTYDPNMNVARPNGQNLSAGNPLVLQPGSSLVSSISVSEAGHRPQLQTAAVLTVLDSVPPAGSFRPPYAGSDKTINFNISQINWSLLKQLPPVSETPDMATVERYFERPWLDHIPTWMGREQHPVDNAQLRPRNVNPGWHCRADAAFGLYKR